MAADIIRRSSKRFFCDRIITVRDFDRRNENTMNDFRFDRNAVSDNRRGHLQIPEWARLENMEASTSQEKLWKMNDRVYSEQQKEMPDKKKRGSRKGGLRITELLFGKKQIPVIAR